MNKINTIPYKDIYSIENLLISLVFNILSALTCHKWFINENHYNATSKIVHSENWQHGKFRHKSHLCFKFYLLHLQLAREEK